MSSSILQLRIQVLACLLGLQINSKGIWELETKANVVTELVTKTVKSAHDLSLFAFLAASNFLKLCTM